VEACGDIVIELIDYTCRQIAWLCRTTLEDEEEDEDEGDADECNSSHAETINDDSNLGTIIRQRDDMQWRIALASVTILRYLCEHASQLSLSAKARILDIHDVPCLVIPLIEAPPWTRRDGRNWEKFKPCQNGFNNKGGEWEIVPPEDLLKMTIYEAQPWLILFNILCDKEMRERYHFHSFRKDTILRVRKYLNEVLLDQLPVLADVQRYMDELTILDAPPSTKSNGLVFEQVAPVRESLFANTDWKVEAINALKTKFSEKESKDDPMVIELANLYADEGIEFMLSGNETLSEVEAKKTNKDIDDITISESETKDPERTSICATLILASDLNVKSSKIVYSCGNREGLLQKTSKGNFIRYQLTEITESNNKSASFTIPEGDNSEQLFTVEIQDEDGFTTVLNCNQNLKEMLQCKSPAEVHAKRNDGCWVSFGSLETKFVVQVRCCLVKHDETFRVGEFFLSTAASSNELGV